MKSKSFGNGKATLYLGDCIQVLSFLEDESIDFIVTDPPYGCSTTVITRKGQKDLDSNFGDWDCFFTDWLQEAYRVLKQNSGMIIFVPATRFESLMNQCSLVGLKYVQPWFWYRTNPAVSMRNTLQWAVEHMLYVRKGTHKLKIDNHGKCHNIFKHASTKKDRFHPTQKPIALMVDIIKYVSSKADTILDPFNGSGSTGVAAVSQERRYIGIEIDKTYFEKSCERFKSRIPDYIWLG